MGRALTPGDLTPILRSVEKPGRYVGGEFGAHVKAQAALRVAISYPDLYEIGMSNAAVKILYSLLNALPDVSCERVFAPAPDFEAALRGAGVPLVLPGNRAALVAISTSSGSPLATSLPSRTSWRFWRRAGSPSRQRDAAEMSPSCSPGGPAATNPVPLGLFVDAVFIGEAEGWLGGAFSPWLP